MNKLGITRGKVKAQHSESNLAFNVVGTDLGGRYKIARFPYMDYGDGLEDFTEQHKLEANGNANLYAEAHNVANETGLSPLQLKEQRDELLAVIKKVKQDYGSLASKYELCKAINNCENTLK